MGRCCLLALAISITVIAALNPDTAAGARRYRLLAGLFDGVPGPGRVETTEGISFGPPGPHRYSPYESGNPPWYGYGLGVPTYNWGYFGVPYRPFSVSHKGYYGEFQQWSYRRGY